MPYDYEYATRLGWRPSYPGERSAPGERREAAARRPPGQWQGSVSAFGSNSGRIPGDAPEQAAPPRHELGVRQSPGHYGKGPKGYTRADDRILEDVCERLRDDSEVDATEVNVTVREGEVILEGSVSDRSEKHRAIDLAESVGGVRCVTSLLRTGPRTHRRGATEVS